MPDENGSAWMEYHRVDTGEMFSTFEQGNWYARGAPGPRLFAFLVRSEGAGKIAERSAEIVRSCLTSTAIHLGMLEEDDLCGAPDNCPGIPNPMQDDQDHDGIGDACTP